MSNLDKILEAAMELPLEQQEMLVQILKNRIIESRRDEIASKVKRSPHIGIYGVSLRIAE